MKKAQFLTVALALSGGLLLGQSSKIAADLQQVTSGNVNVIVKFSQAPTSTQNQLVTGLGGSSHRSLNSIKAGAYTMPAAALANLANNSNVVHIDLDHALKTKLDYTTAATNASAAWTAGWTGAGVGVAIIDSGITVNQDLENSAGVSRVVYSQDFTGSGSASDGYGHGTHIAGIIGGNGHNSSCSNCTRLLQGMAPNANIIDLRVFDQNGQSSDSEVIAAIDEAIALKSTYNIRVINLSLGRAITESYTLDPLCQEVEAAWNAGIVVVVAAGNDGRDNSVGENGYGTINAPGNDPYVITVGAMKAMDTYSRTDDLIASYSSKGPSLYDNVIKPDIVAPGNQVVSVEASGTNYLFTNYPANSIPVSYYTAGANPNPAHSYFRLNGTSMAAAVVSGAAADLLQAQPKLTPDQVKARLMQTAYKTFPQSSIATDPITGATYISCYDIFTVGAGYLDLAAALASTYTPTGNSLSPTATFNPTAGTILLNFAPASIWTSLGASGTSSMWATAVTNGTSGITGSSSIWATSSSWATSSVWATSSIWATNSIWSSSGIWGTSSIWATSSVWATDATQATSLMMNGEN